METLAPTKRSCKTSSGLTDEPGFGDNESSSYSDLDVAERLQVTLGLIEWRWRQEKGRPTFDGSMEQNLLRSVHSALGQLAEFYELEGMA